MFLLMTFYYYSINIYLRLRKTRDRIRRIIADKEERAQIEEANRKVNEINKNATEEAISGVNHCTQGNPNGTDVIDLT